MRAPARAAQAGGAGVSGEQDQGHRQHSDPGCRPEPARSEGADQELPRYEYGSGMVPIPVIEYRQMAGRGEGRGDPYGESFLMAKDDSEMRI